MCDTLGSSPELQKYSEIDYTHTCTYTQWIVVNKSLVISVFYQSYRMTNYKIRLKVNIIAILDEQFKRAFENSSFIISKQWEEREKQVFTKQPTNYIS